MGSSSLVSGDMCYLWVSQLMIGVKCCEVLIKSYSTKSLQIHRTTVTALDMLQSQTLDNTDKSVTAEFTLANPRSQLSVL